KEKTPAWRSPLMDHSLDWAMRRTMLRVVVIGTKAKTNHFSQTPIRFTSNSFFGLAILVYGVLTGTAFGYGDGGKRSQRGWSGGAEEERERSRAERDRYPWEAIALGW